MQLPAFVTPRVRETERETIIRSTKGWSAVQFGELWERRELIWIFGLRDVSVRYKQTALGISWAIIQPVMTMVVFSVIFGEFVNVPSDGLPYPIFSFSGVLPWTLFAAAITAVGMSVVTAGQLIKRAYMPRLVMPLAACIPPLVDFAIAFVVLLGLVAWYGIAPSLLVLFLPLVVAMICLAALSLGLWIAVLNVYYRDFRYVTPIAVQLLMFLSPVIYPPTLVAGSLAPLFYLNPMFSLIQAFRACMLGTAPPDMGALAVAVAIVLILLVSGLMFFRRFEQAFADAI
jgi:lipopolysaccharide transport system permease protein